MGMKPLGNETPMKIRGAVTSPKSVSNTSARGSVTQTKPDMTEHAQPIKGAISKPKTK